MSRDCTSWLDEREVGRLLDRAGAVPEDRAEIPHTVIGGVRAWNFWAVQDWLDERVRYRNKGD